MNELATMVADGYRDLPVTIERIAGHSGCGDHLVARSSWGQDTPGILVLSHLDTLHPIGFIERLPFRTEAQSIIRSLGFRMRTRTIHPPDHRLKASAVSPS